MHYEEEKLAQGRSDLLILRDDTPKAAGYADDHLAKFAELDGGKLYQSFLDEHDKAVANLDELLAGLRTLLSNGAGRIDTTIEAYADNEQANVDEVKGLWSALDGASNEPPLGRPTDGGVSAGPLPSEVLAPPETWVNSWIFKIVSWPDYLSIGSWARKIFTWIWQWSTGKDGDPWQILWSWIGGDWEAVGKASDAWKNLSGFVEALSDEVTVRMQLMFEGWYDSAAATACGSYFAQAAEAISSGGEPLTELGNLCNHIAWSSFYLYQGIFSLIDAAIDAIVAFLAGGSSIGEAIAALFSGGTTAIPAAASAIIAIIQALSAVWGATITVVYMITGLGELLATVLNDVKWVDVPEG